MIYQSPQNPNSHITAIERTSPSYPTRQLFSKGLIIGEVLDFGCGVGADVAFLKAKGFEITGYDPFYANEYPKRRFDTILCNYVLNVLLPEEETFVLMAVSELLEPGGKAYFSVRRDIKRNGFRTHLKHSCQVYQCNVVLPYRSILKTEHCEIYEYRHYNILNHRTQNECIFCSPNKTLELLSESATAFSILDKYPVSQGHALVIPKKHTQNYFDLPERAKTACWLMVDRVKELLTSRFNPDGYNIGINIGEASGQTIPHVHIHIIPRYYGDIEDPTGGVRNVIPGKGNYRKIHKITP